MKTIFDDKYRRMVEEIKNLRKSKGLSQRDLAKKTRRHALLYRAHRDLRAAP